MYSQDVANLKAFWAKRGFKPTMKLFGTESAVFVQGEPVITSYSPSIKEILDFTCYGAITYWRTPSQALFKAVGYPFNDKGVAITFAQLLSTLILMHLS